MPSQEEAESFLEELHQDTRAAAAVMIYRGLRVGALPSLRIRAGRFSAESKGKEITGTMPEEALREVKAAGLEMRSPFAHLNAEKIRDRIRYVTGKLHKAGEIGAPYSAHDFRHLYAITEYRMHKDIYRLKQLLGHASIQVTEHYLQGLNVL